MNNNTLKGTDDRTPRAIRNFTILGILLWFFSALIASWMDFFPQRSEPPTHIAFFVLMPMIVLTGLYIASARFRLFANGISLPLITAAHLWRFVGIGFILAYLFGKLPPQFGIPEGLGDILAAGFAFPLARALYRRRPVRRAFIAWNIFGLVDLVSAITMGVLYSQGSFGILRSEVSTELMTTFPIGLIPTFFVPFFILLHALSLSRYKDVESSGRAETQRLRAAA